MAIVRRILLVSVHVALFIAAILIFVLGLGVGLSLNPLLGMVLWLVAALTAGGNVWWIVRRSNTTDTKEKK